MARKKRKTDQATAELLAPDTFQTTGARSASWVESNAKYILAGLVAILGLILLVESLSSSRARTQSEMTAMLNEAIDAFEGATDIPTVLTSTVPERVKQGYRDSQKKLAAFRERYPDEPAAALAGLYEAELWRRLDQPDKAIPLYEAYLARLGEEGAHAFLAHEGAGYAYEKQGKLDEALTHFERMGRSPFAKGYALKHQARVWQAKGDAERAKALYREIAELDPASPLKAFAEERLKMLE